MGQVRKKEEEIHVASCIVIVQQSNVFNVSGSFKKGSFQLSG